MLQCLNLSRPSCTYTLAPQLPSPSARRTVSHGPHTLAPIHLHPNFPAPAREKLSPTSPIHLHPYTCTPTSKPQREKNCLSRTFGVSGGGEWVVMRQIQIPRFARETVFGRIVF